jgi:hypothetical protein
MIPFLTKHLKQTKEVDLIMVYASMKVTDFTMMLAAV